MGLLVQFLALADPAGANTPGVTGCTVPTTAAAQLGTYPAWPGTQSALRVACVFQHDTGTDTTAFKFTIHDFQNAVWHNGAARNVTATGTFPGSSITIATCEGMGAWVNRTISQSDGSGVLTARTFVKSVTGAGPCTLNLNLPLLADPTGHTFKIDNAATSLGSGKGGGRSVVDGTATSGSTTLTSSTANFTADDTGCSVSGTEIKIGTTMTFVNSTTVTLSTAADGSAAGTGVYSFCGTSESTTTRQMNDASYPANNQITSAGAVFKSDDIGLPVKSTGGPDTPITSPCYIVSVAGNTATLNTTCVNTGGVNKKFVVGDASITAPTDGETAMDQGVQLDLQPSIANGRPCSDNAVEGFHIAGVWENPGDFFQSGAALFGTQPTGTKAIGEIQIKTSAGINYGAFIVQKEAGAEDGVTNTQPQTAAHYDVVWPNVPTAIAQCASTAGSPGLGYSMGIVATTPSVALLPTGTGRPGTGQLRATRDNALNGAFVGVNSTAYLRSDDGVHTYSGAAFQRLCVIPATAPTVSFKCGTG